MNQPVQTGSAMLGLGTFSMVVSAVVSAGPFFQVLMYITSACASIAACIYYVKGARKKDK